MLKQKTCLPSSSVDLSFNATRFRLEVNTVPVDSMLTATDAFHVVVFFFFRIIKKPSE